MNTIKIETPLGYPIFTTQFKPQKTPKSIVLISSATGVKQTYYYMFAEFLKSENYVVYTFDFGGVGLSKTSSLKTFDTTPVNWGKNDLESMLKFVKKQHPNLKLNVIGHSIGGQLIGLAPSSKIIDNIILVASQTGYWKFWKGTEKMKMLVNWYVLFPFFTKIFGYFPGKKLGVMEDLPKSISYQWRKWCVSPNYLFDYLKEEELFYKNIHCNINSFSAFDDNYAPKEAVTWLTNKYENAKIDRIHLFAKDNQLRKIGHFGFFKEKMESTIWKLFLEKLL